MSDDLIPCACLDNECCGNALAPGFRCRKAKGGDVGTLVAAGSGTVATRNGALSSNLDAFRDRIDAHFGPRKEGVLKTPYFLHETEWIELRKMFVAPFEADGIDWPREVTAILEGVPGAVRVREGGGPENLAMSLAVTVAKLARSS